MIYLSNTDSALNKLVKRELYHHNKKMKFLIPLLSLYLCLPLWAFTPRDLTPQVFSLRVTPTLTSIQSDFFQVLNQFADFPKELPPLINKFYLNQEIKIQLPLECPRDLNSQCIKEIAALKKYIVELNESLDSVISTLRPASANELNPLIGIKHISSASNHLWGLKMEMDVASFLIDAQLPSNLKSLEVIHKLDQVRSELILAMLEFIPVLYQREFKTFYNEFIDPLRMNKNHDFFISHFARLNFNLNLFVQSLTKRNKKTPEGSNQYLQLMHMRWNGILRFYK